MLACLAQPASALLLLLICADACRRAIEPEEVQAKLQEQARKTQRGRDLADKPSEPNAPINRVLALPLMWHQDLGLHYADTERGTLYLGRCEACQVRLVQHQGLTCAGSALHPPVCLRTRVASRGGACVMKAVDLGKESVEHLFTEAACLTRWHIWTVSWTLCSCAGSTTGPPSWPPLTWQGDTSKCCLAMTEPPQARLFLGLRRFAPAKTTAHDTA